VLRKSSFHLLFLVPKSSFGSHNIAKLLQKVAACDAIDHARALNPRFYFVHEKGFESAFGNAGSGLPNRRLGGVIFVRYLQDGFTKIQTHAMTSSLMFDTHLAKRYQADIAHRLTNRIGRCAICIL
jgi:hypothetical protein